MIASVYNSVVHIHDYLTQKLCKGTINVKIHRAYRRTSDKGAWAKYPEYKRMRLYADRGRYDPTCADNRINIVNMSAPITGSQVKFHENSTADKILFFALYTKL